MDHDSIPLHVWTLRNSLGAIPEGMRGPNYLEHRFMVLSRTVIHGTAYHNQDCTYAISVFPTSAKAYQAAIEMTTALEALGHMLETSPREARRGSAAARYYANLGKFVGTDATIDAGFYAAIREGAVMA